MNKLGVQTEGFQMDSQAKFLAIARGDSDVYLRLSSTPGRLEKIWDIVAGALIIMESGAKVSYLVGNIVSLNHGKTVGVDSLFATNANLYDKVFQAIKDVENENSNCQ